MRIADLQRAEDQLDEAMEELRRYSQTPDEWAAHERIDDADQRVLVLHKSHFEKREMLQRRVEGAQNNLRALQVAFAAGGAL